MIDNDVRDAYSVWISDRGEGTLTRFVDAFAAGAAWQKELDSLPFAPTGSLSSQSLDAEIELDEIRNAIATLGEGMAAILQGTKSLQEAGLRGADRGVAFLEHLQEIGDNVRGVGGAIGDKFGVMLDAIKDVGEKVEACMALASNTEEGIAASIDKLDKLGVEKWREAIKHVEAEGAPADGVDASGLGKLWDETPVSHAPLLQDVDDATLRDLATTEQIDGRRYWQEVDRRQKDRLNKMAEVHIGVDLAKPGSDQTAMAIIRDGGKVRGMGATSEGFQVWEGSGGLVVIGWRGNIYMLRGMSLTPLQIKA